MGTHFFYCEYSETIRLAPGNYCFAIKTENGFRFDADLGIDLPIVQKVMRIVHSHGFHWDEPRKTIQRLNEKLND